MKKTFFLMFLFSVLSTSAQTKFKAGLLAGLVTSQVRGDTYSGFNKASYILGGFASRALSDKWEAKFEIDLLQKGSKKNQDPENGNYDYYLLRLNYIEVPVMLRYKYKNWKIEGGMAFAALFKTKEYTEYGEITGYLPFRKSDISELTGLGYVFNDKLEFDIRFENSVVPVRKFRDANKYYGGWFSNIFNQGNYNNVLSFALHYSIK